MSSKSQKPVFSLLENSPSQSRYNRDEPILNLVNPASARKSEKVESAKSLSLDAPNPQTSKQDCDEDDRSEPQILASPVLGGINLTPNGTSGEQFQTEISAYVSIGGKLFILSSGGGSTLQITDATNPAAASLVGRTSLGNYTSQSVVTFGNLVAVALAPVDYNQNPQPGLVRFYRLGKDGSLNILKDVSVGYLPDGLAFSEDGSTLVVANEGQPNWGTAAQNYTDAYTLDPKGSISLISIKGLDDDGYVGKSPLRFRHKELTFDGITLPEGLRLSGPAGTTASQDIEPEYVTIQGDYAYVTLQENNGVAKVDLESQKIVEVFALGSVDFSRQAVDLTDRPTSTPPVFNPLLGQPFQGLRMPDGIDAFKTGGRTYFITANEGDSRVYPDIDGSAKYVDEQRNTTLASPDNRLKTIVNNVNTPSAANSNVAFGSRSVSIFDAKTGSLVWDSGNSLQTIAFAAGSYDDSRSDDKGVEPETVLVTKLRGRQYAIVALERATSTASNPKSTLVVFDVTEPASSRYVSHLVIDGSQSPEGLMLIPEEDSPTGQPLLVVSNEISNTLNFIDLETLLATPGPGSAGFFKQTMLKDVAGGDQLEITSLITNGEFTNGLNSGDSVYTPTGIFDGLGAYDNGDGTYTVLANSELGNTNGVGYLVDGVALKGARVSQFIVDKDVDDNASNGFQSAIIRGGIAYRSIYDANGNQVTNANQIGGGFSRFCSATFVAANSFGAGRGFANGVYLTGEETSQGLMWALDVANGAMWALPGLGRGGWETSTLVDTGSSQTVGVLLMDDNTAPIYLWVGQKSTAADANFLQRNGLDAASGSLYTWVPTNGSIGTEAGTAGVPDSADLRNLAMNTSASGSWVLVGTGTEVAALNDISLRALANSKGALQLSRLEDVHVNPANGQEVVFATTGNSAFGAADAFGNLLTLNLQAAFDASGQVVSGNSTSLKVLYDADRLTTPATGIRNPDNLAWSADGSIYVQEDRSTPAANFAPEYGEASIWKVNPAGVDPLTGQVTAERWAQIDRNAVPAVYGQSDTVPLDYGNWESSGIIDVSKFYGAGAGSYFLADVQAHSLRNGNLAGASYLVEGGQLDLIHQVSPGLP